MRGREWVYRFRRQRLHVRDLSASTTTSGTLLSAGPGLRTTEDDPDALREIEFPAVSWSLHRGVRVRSDLPAVVSGRSLLVGPLLNESLTHGEPALSKNSVLQGRSDRAVIRRSGRTIRLPRGIFLGGFGPRAYFHHLCERVSRLTLLDHLPAEFQEFPILVPEETLKVQSLVDATRLLAPDRDLIPLSWEDEYLVDELVWMDEIHRWVAGYPGVVTHTQAMRIFRERILESLSIEPRTEPGLRIFVDRGEHRRSPEAEHFPEIARSFGFTVWRPEQSSFATQVRKWARIEAVVGESGAAWSGALFAPQHARGLVVTDGSASGWPHLGRISGMEVDLLRTSDPARFARALAERFAMP